MTQPLSTRDDVERIKRIAAAAARPLQPAPSPEAQFGNTSWAPSDAPSTMGDLARAMFTNDRAALLHGWRIRNRRHPTELK